MNQSEKIKLAQQWRSQQSSERSEFGIVLIWNNVVYGWKNELRDAGHERPGVIAIDAAGHIFEAKGGDDVSGAKCWVAIDG
ncbi:antirestriction protein ArdR [sulfur-oxidizing endosymbiont of Gigantopelta aegis]|uniref:antirestriction protein ArdR n=1 Tax=sulfur-oxidizing endosymbiont of Gigantopelta aegis TaxID=2794934 RepID=UPI0018DD458D|nr:antirestriction protein ArdR [sulfur-oxidizing endosymbiont of Gigantopelta aegis]